MLTVHEIGYRLKGFREDHGFSQQDLSGKLINRGINLSRETISKIESGNRNITVLEIKALAEVLNVSYEEIVKDDSEKDNLVALFRRENYPEEGNDDLLFLQEFFEDIILQIKLNKGESKYIRREAFWRS